MPTEFITDPKLAIILALLFSKLKQSTYRFPVMGIVFNLIGTFFHELAHWVIGFLLNAKPASFSIIPVRTSDGWMLGSVEIRNPSWYNVIPVALAPLLLLMLAFTIDDLYMSTIINKTLMSDFGYLLVMVILVDNSIPSMQDIRLAVSSSAGIMFYSIALGVIIYYLKGNFA